MADRDKLLDIVFEALDLDGRRDRDHKLAEEVVDKLLAFESRELALLRARNLDLEAARLRLTDELQGLTEERDSLRRDMEALADEWGASGNGRLGSALELRASLQRGMDNRG